MMCFAGIASDPVFLIAVGISLVAAVVLLWMLKFQKFHGKTYYALTFIAMIWTLIMVGSEAASSTFACQLQWATLAWLGNGMVPIAWCFFVFAYVDNAAWLKTRRVGAALVLIPAAIFLLAATNPWHHLVYTDASIIPPGEDHIVYSHGSGFYAIIATLYAFVLATLFCLGRAFTRSKRAAWPILSMLTVITAIPIAANAAYVGLGFTVFGLDPTAFMFTLGILAFTWMLIANRTMDMATVGQSVLFNTMSEPVVMIDRQQNIVLMNTAARRIEASYGFGHVLGDLLAGIETLATSDDLAHISFGNRVYEPRIREIESPLSPSRSVLGWSVTFVDITDRLNFSVALERALQAAGDANRAKDEFISVISHELRTPLTSLKGGLALALSGHLGELPDPIRSSLEIANRNGDRLSRLVDNILLAQKIDFESLALEEKPVNLGQLLEESLDENRNYASVRGVQLVKAKVAQNAIVLGDAFAIRQIIDNLVSNAIKFSNGHGVVESTVEIIGDRVRLSIQDTGNGIPPGMEEKVFGRFEQVNDGGQSSTGGSGLGLHISRKLAKRLSGNLFYESQVGIGTTFHVDFSLMEQKQLPEPRVQGVARQRRWDRSGASDAPG